MTFRPVEIDRYWDKAETEKTTVTQRTDEMMARMLSWPLANGKLQLVALLPKFGRCCVPDCQSTVKLPISKLSAPPSSLPDDQYLHVRHSLLLELRRIKLEYW